MAFPFDCAVDGPAPSLVRALLTRMLWLLDRILEPVCLLCQQVSERQHGLCDTCARSLPLNKTACNVCARPIETGSICGKCLSKPNDFDHAIAPLLYREPVSEMIQALKYREKLAFARTAASVISEAALKRGVKKPDLICSVPMTTQALRKRGFNQSALIALLSGYRLGIPVTNHLLRKVRQTAHQSDLSARERRGNLKNAFRCQRGVAGRHVVIVDDVLTTGATVNELARTLKKAGAARVDVWVCARTD